MSELSGLMQDKTENKEKETEKMCEKLW